MIITTHIDLTPDAYRFFLKQAEICDVVSAEDMISMFLEEYVESVVKQGDSAKPLI